MNSRWNAARGDGNEQFRGKEAVRFPFELGVWGGVLVWGFFFFYDHFDEEEIAVLKVSVSPNFKS